MKVVHVELAEANLFVHAFHRHHKPVVGHRFSVGAHQDGLCVGVAIVGRPVARQTDQQHTVEVLRLCTNGEKNACSFLYAVCARAAKELGYKSIQTFILNTEDGVTLRAAGWTKGGTTHSSKKGWQSRDGRRTDQPTIPKVRYFKLLN